MFSVGVAAAAAAAAVVVIAAVVVVVLISVIGFLTSFVVIVFVEVNLAQSA